MDPPYGESVVVVAAAVVVRVVVAAAVVVVVVIAAAVVVVRVVAVVVSKYGVRKHNYIAGQFPHTPRFHSMFSPL